MNNNQEYNNFNGYQPQPQPVNVQAQPVFPQVNYQMEDQNKKTANTLGIISIVGSVLSCCCCGATSIAGIIMSAIGLNKNKGNILCIIGLVLSILTLIGTIASIAMNGAAMFSDPAFMQEFTEAYNEAYNEAMMQSYQ